MKYNNQSLNKLSNLITLFRSNKDVTYTIKDLNKVRGFQGRLCTIQMFVEFLVDIGIIECVDMNIKIKSYKLKEYKGL